MKQDKDKKQKKKPGIKPKEPSKPTAGAPTLYSKEMAAAICARVADGQSIRTIRKDALMPEMSTIFRWLTEYPEFKEQYTAAKALMPDAMLEDCMDIIDNQADQPLLIDGVPMQIDGVTVMVKDAVSVAHAKARVETRMKLMGMLAPKKYGTKLELAGDPTAPFTGIVRRVI